MNTLLKNAAICCVLAFGLSLCPAHIHAGPTHVPVQQDVRFEDEELQRIEDDIARKEEQETRRDIVVYTCFGLSLLVILWMRKRSKEEPDA